IIDVGNYVQDINAIDPNGGGLTLLDVISAEIQTSSNNGWFAALARHAVAAYLNAAHNGVGYEYSTSYILSSTKAAFEQDYKNLKKAIAAAQTLHNKFRAANERLCPLGNESSAIVLMDSSETSKVAVTAAVNDVAVYPVPFSDIINVGYTLDYVSDVQINIFDFGNNLLKSVTDSQVTSGSVTEIAVDFNINVDQIYILQVKTDRDTFVKQIIAKP